MIRPRWRKVLRDLWLHKSRTLLVVLAITLGIVGAGSVLDTWSLVRKVTVDGYLASDPASATLRTDSIDAALLARVRALPAIRDAQARRTVIGSARVPSAWATAALFTVDDLSAIRIGRVRAESGAWPPADGAIVVETSSVTYAGTALGDSMTIQVGDAAPRTLAVGGIARDVGLAPGWMEHVVYGFVTRATLASLGAPTSLNELQIVVRDRSLDREAIRRIAFDVKALVETTGRRVTDVAVPVPGRHIHAAQMDSLLFTQGAFGALTLLLSAFLVINLVTAMLAGQVREIGVMKAIGAETGQIARMYLGLALVLGLASCALALPIAAFIGHRYAEFTADLLNFDVTGVSIPLSTFALQLVVGALLPVVAAAVPVVRGCRIHVSDALRDLGITPRAGTGRGWLMSRLAGVKRPMRLALANAFRKRQRTALTLLTLATGGAVFLGALNLRTSARGVVDLLFGPQHFDIALRLAQPSKPDSIEAVIARVPGVGRAEAWATSRAGVARTDSTISNTFPLVAPPPSSDMLAYPLLQGRWLGTGDSNALVVNQRLVEDEPGLRIGEQVTLITGGRRSRWTIVGVVEAGPSPTAFVPRDMLARSVSGGLVDRAVVRAASSGAASQLDLVQRLRAELARAGLDVQSTQLMTESRRVMEDHLLMVAGFLGIMAQLMIVVGGLGLASTMSLAVLERTREIGVLRAIGARHRTILGMVQIEGLVISIASWALAIPLSMPMSVVLCRAFGRVLLPVPLVWIPARSGVLLWLAVAAGVSLIACAWPAFRAMRVTTAVALAYE